MSMLTVSLLHDFKSKVARALHEMEDLQSQLNEKMTREVEELDKQAIRIAKYRGYIEIICGVGGAAAAFSGAFSNNQAAQKVAEAWKSTIQSAEKILGTFLNAEQNRRQQASAQITQHKRPRATKMEEELRNEFQRLLQQVNEALSKESAAAGYRVH